MVEVLTNFDFSFKMLVLVKNGYWSVKTEFSVQYKPVEIGSLMFKSHSQLVTGNIYDMLYILDFSARKTWFK